MKLLEKKIYGFTVLEIGIGAFVLMNLSTIMSFLKLGTKPLENLSEDLKAKQTQNTLGLSDALAQFMRQASEDMYAILNPPESFFVTDIDEKALVDYILSKFTTSSYWSTFKKYYKEDRGKDVVNEIKECVTKYFDRTEYNRIEDAVRKGQSYFRELL